MSSRVLMRTFLAGEARIFFSDDFSCRDLKLIFFPPLRPCSRLLFRLFRGWRAALFFTHNPFLDLITPAQRVRSHLWLIRLAESFLRTQRHVFTCYSDHELPQWILPLALASLLFGIVIGFSAFILSIKVHIPDANYHRFSHTSLLRLTSGSSLDWRMDHRWRQRSRPRPPSSSRMSPALKNATFCFQTSLKFTHWHIKADKSSCRRRLRSEEHTFSQHPHHELARLDKRSEFFHFTPASHLHQQNFRVELRNIPKRTRPTARMRE